MQRTVLAVLISGLVGVAYGQSHGGSGSYAGGHTGSAYSGGARSGAYGSSGYRGGNSNGNRGHQRTVVVPYAVPYFVGGYGYYAPYYNGDPSASSGYADPSAQGPADDQGLPSVMVNPSYVPERANPQVQEYGAPMGPLPDQSSMRMYQNRSYPYADTQAPRPMQRVAPGSDEPTIYLIAFKDHTIVQALGYWVEGGTLHYVSTEQTVNQASMALIDRTLSQRLNDERNVEFKLPAR